MDQRINFIKNIFFGLKNQIIIFFFYILKLFKFIKKASLQNV